MSLPGHKASRLKVQLTNLCILLFYSVSPDWKLWFTVFIFNWIFYSYNSINNKEFSLKCHLKSRDAHVPNINNKSLAIGINNLIGFLKNRHINSRSQCYLQIWNRMALTSGFIHLSTFKALECLTSTVHPPISCTTHPYWVIEGTGTSPRRHWV